MRLGEGAGLLALREQVMDGELKAAIRREALETWCTVKRCAAVVFLVYAATELLKLLASG